MDSQYLQQHPVHPPAAWLNTCPQIFLWPASVEGDRPQSNLDSDLLLLLIGEGENLKSFYSAKIFEYLRSGKPILAIAPKGGVVEQLLLESEHGSAFSARQIPEIKAMILNEYLKWKSGRGGPLLHSPAIEKFEGKCLTRQLADVLRAQRKS